jgi:hypothetical protein
MNPTPTPTGTGGPSDVLTYAQSITAGIASWALAVSILGFLVGAYSLGWQIYKTTIWARPRLVVTGTWSTMQHSTRAGRWWELEVTVANIGDVETQIEDVYWEFRNTDSGDALFRVKGSTMDASPSFHADQLGITYGGIVSPELPVPIPPFSSRRWMLRRPDHGSGKGDDLRSTTFGRAAVQWVSRSKVNPAPGENPHMATSYGPWQRNPLPPGWEEPTDSE